jgi:Tol biopolymer transport system component
MPTPVRTLLLTCAAVPVALALLSGPASAVPGDSAGTTPAATGADGARAGCADGSWRILRSPNAGRDGSTLWGVTAVSAADAWAVGSFVDPATDKPQTLTQHWDGKAWTVVASPVVRGNGTLSAVDATSSTDVWAVGRSWVDEASEAGGRTLVEHWDGTAWRVVPSPNTGIEGGNGSLQGVWARAADDVWAVGSYFPAVEQPTLKPLIEHWDGTKWELVPNPRRNLGPWSELHAVAGTGPSDVWAVGGRDVRVGDIVTTRALIMHWDGLRWRRVPEPAPFGRQPYALRDVVALSPTDAWAVGDVSDRHRTRTVVMHWDGRSWKLVPSANPSAQFQALAGVAAASPRRVWAVGSYYDSDARQMRTLVERWTGTRWRQVPSGNRPSPELKLHDVAAVRRAQFAVGSSGVRRERTLVVRRCRRPDRPSVPPAVAASPGANGSLVLTSDRDGDSELYLRNRSDRLRRLTRNHGADFAPAWSPDGRRIAFVSDRDGDEDIYVMNVADGGMRQLTRNRRASDGAPAWSPDGARLAFASTRGGGESDIYVMNADGTHPRRLTQSPVVDHTPAWSPDGRQIAFTSIRDGDSSPQIYLMRPNGRGLRRLTSIRDGDNSGPAWSPDGTRIAFSSNRHGSQEIYVMRADGSRQARLTRNDRDDTFPRWSPDGSRIVFTGDTGIRSSALFTIDADGSAQRQLTRGVHSDFFADWQPLPTVLATSSGDRLSGTEGHDLARLLGGDDRFDGLSGNDVVFAGAGSDTVRGGRGGDVLVGGPGADELTGGPGEDLLNVRDGVGGDVVRGGPGVDLCLTDARDRATGCEPVT